jgi:O-acetyl-ADP-ribose deacetylase (regulator of RNase III)
VIQILREDPIGVEADAFLRSVGSDLEACTSLDREAGDRAGSEVLDRLRAFGETPVGAAFVTPGGGLSAPLLIHVVLRSRDEPISPTTLARALRNGLRQAAEWGIETLSLPPLGIGAGNLDAELSARVMCRVIRDHAVGHAHPNRVLIGVTSAYEAEVFRAAVGSPPDSGESGPAAPG